jgi:hypothetical protein
MNRIKYRSEQEPLDGRHAPGGITLVWKLGFLVTCIFALGAISEAQTATLTLLEDLSSKLPTGTEFTARDAAGRVYKGHVVTHPAQRLLRRGSMSLVFDDPVVPVTKDREGIFRAGNKMRLLKLGGSLAAAKLADDAVDGAIGATKARYVAVGVAAALVFFQKGGEATLHKGDTIDVEPRRGTLWKSD